MQVSRLPILKENFALYFYFNSNLFWFGFGSLQEGNGRLRIKVKQSNLGAKIAKKLKDKQQVQKAKSGFTSGLSSSLAFTPVQGFELENPNKQMSNKPGEESGYFSEVAGFEKVRKDSININIAPRK